MKRRIMRACCVLMACFLFAPRAMAQERAPIEETIRSVLDGIDFSSVEGITLLIPGEETPLGVKEAVAQIASGKTFSIDAVMESAIEQFFSRLGALKATMLAIMLPVLLASLLTHTLPGGGGGMKEMSKSACVVLVFVPVIALVVGELEHTRDTIVAMTTRMDKMLPMLLTLLTALGGSASSAFLHPVVIAASGSMVFLAREVVLRLVMCTCAVTAVNRLSGGAHLTRMAQLLRSAVCWMLGVSFTVFLGAMSLQGICTASIDGVAIRAAKYAVDNFVPIIGGMFSDTMDTLVGCTLIVKNALGIAAALALLGALLSPLIGTAASIFLLKLCAALLEPVADQGVVAAIGDFSKTIVLFFVTMLCVATMYFLLIVQVLLVGNLTVMLR